MDASDKPGFDILLFTPARAIMIAYSMYLADNRKPGTLAQKSAAMVVERIQAEIASFNGNDRATQYLTDWQLCVNDCCGDITVRKQRRDDELRAIRRAHDHGIHILGRKFLVFGLLNVVWQLLVVGLSISIYAVVLHCLVAFNIHVASDSTPTDPHMTACVVACGTGLLLSAWRLWSVPHRQEKLEKKLFNGIDSIHERYREDARREYGDCARQIAALWLEFHDTDAPPTDGLESLIDVSGEGFNAALEKTK